MKRARFTWVAYAIMICSLTTFAQPDTLWTKDLWMGDVAGVFETDDGGVLLVTSNMNIDSLPVRITKLSATGDSLWSVQYDAPYSWDVCEDARRFANGDFLLKVTSFQPSQPWETRQVRLTEAGEVVWERECALDLFTIATDSSIIDVQVQEREPFDDLLVTKLSASLDTIWSQRLSFGIEDIWAEQVVVDQWNRVLVSGALVASSDISPGGGFVVCMDQSGLELWRADVRDNGAIFANINLDVRQDSAVVATGTWFHSADTDAGFLKISARGEILLNIHFLPDGNIDAILHQAIRSRSGALLCAGATDYYSNQPWFFRLNENGNVEWEVCCWRDWTSRIWKQYITELPDGGFLLTASTLFGGLPEDNSYIHLARLTPDPLSGVRPSGEGPYSIWLYPNYPNPFNATTEISFDLPHSMHASLKIFDVLGREVAELVNGVLDGSKHTVTFDANALSSGVYFYRLEAGKFGETRKMVLLK